MEKVSNKRKRLSSPAPEFTHADLLKRIKKLEQAAAMKRQRKRPTVERVRRRIMHSPSPSSVDSFQSDAESETSETHSFNPGTPCQRPVIESESDSGKDSLPEPLIPNSYSPQ